MMEWCGGGGWQWRLQQLRNLAGETWRDGVGEMTGDKRRGEVR